MRRNSLEDLVVLALVLGPLRAIAGERAIWQAWIGLVSGHLAGWWRNAFGASWPIGVFQSFTHGDSHQGGTDER